MEDSDDNVCCKDGLVNSEDDLDLVERCIEEVCLSTKNPRFSTCPVMWRDRKE